MNSNNILEFLDKYKNLDELCKQILLSDRGVSQYIDEMSYESQGYRMIDGWERDYKQLKKMRWIRNCLVHDPNSFEDNLVDVKDIEWLHTFYCRIMECKDPFSLLHQSQKVNIKTDKQEKSPEIYFSTNIESSSQNANFQNRDIILAVMFFAGIVCLVLVVVFFVNIL